MAGDDHAAPTADDDSEHLFEMCLNFIREHGGGEREVKLLQAVRAGREDEILRLAFEGREFSTRFKTPDEEWHISTHCLKPLADLIEKALALWNQDDMVSISDQGLVSVFNRIHSQLRYGSQFTTSDPDIGFAFVWLEVNVSVEVADRFKSLLLGTAQQVGDFAAWRRDRDKAGDLEYHEPVESPDSEVINILGPKNWAAQDQLLKRRKVLRCSLEELIEYIRRLAVVLTAKTEHRPLKMSEVPAPVNPHPFGPLVGNKTELGHALHTKDDLTDAAYRQYFESCTNDSLFQINKGASGQHEAWFQSQARYATASNRLNQRRSGQNG